MVTILCRGSEQYELSGVVKGIPVPLKLRGALLYGYKTVVTGPAIRADLAWAGLAELAVLAESGGGRVVVEAGGEGGGGGGGGPGGPG